IQSTTSYIYTLSLHDALPIYRQFGLDRQLGKKSPTLGIRRKVLNLARQDDVRITVRRRAAMTTHPDSPALLFQMVGHHLRDHIADRKSTRLNSSHQIISYAVF